MINFRQLLVMMHIIFITYKLTEGEINESNIEYPPYNGWNNNFGHPEWGAADTALLRLLPSAYADGVYAPSGATRPNPLDISAAAFDGDTGHSSYLNRTVLLVFFGQQLVEEILDAQGSGCPPEYFNIPIPKKNSLYDPEGHGGREMPFLRTRYDARTGNAPNVPREQLNEVTPFFDGNLMYGPNKAWADALRLFKNGLLAATNDSTDPSALDRDRYFPALNDIRLPFANPPPPRDHQLKPVKRFYKTGNTRGNENPFLLTFGILWFRYHNFRARQLKANHPEWDDDKLFNEARKWVIAVHQKIAYYDWLPAWLDDTLPEYSGYNPHIHPQIAHVFQSAAMRFGHTMVPPGVFRRNSQCEFRNTTKKTKYEGFAAIRTCNSYWNPQEAIRESDIDELLMGMASQLAEREDHIVAPDLRGSVYGQLEFSRRDLMAVNIQRGRDHGLPDYNTARNAFGLSRVERFEDINNSTEPPSLREAIRKTAAVYNNSMDDVDIWTAGMLETTARGPGPLFRAIIKNQFSRIRDGDRFWFENYRSNGLFTADEVNEIRGITLKQIILWVTNIQPHDLQDNIFFHLNGNPCPQPFQLNSQDGHVEQCEEVESYDYFAGNALAYIATITGILFSGVVSGIILICLAKYRKRVVDKKRRRTQNGKRTEGMTPVVEWIGRKQGSRKVFMKMDDAKKRITLYEYRALVRMMDLSKVSSNESVELFLSSDVFNLLIRIPKDYDLVLLFATDHARQTFRQSLEEFFRGVDVSTVTRTNLMKWKRLKEEAITAKIRQKSLDDFFTGVLDRVYENGTEAAESSDRDRSAQFAQCELTKYEFASVLGLQVDSMFVMNMFEIIDKNKTGLITFGDFIDLFVIFSRPDTPEEKARLMFNIYDVNKKGALSRGEFVAMLRSLIEMVGEQVEENMIADLVNSLFSRSGLDERAEITIDDCQKLLHDFHDEIQLDSLQLMSGRVPVSKKKRETVRRETALERIRKTLRPDNQPMGINRSNTTAGEHMQTMNKTMPMTVFQSWMGAALAFFENNRRQIFWVTLYTCVVLGIFMERFYVSAVESESNGLRRICSYGVAVARGAASAMMFTYSSLLVTMCRNLITYLRDTFLHRYIPFDEAVNMHKYIAVLAGISTLTHIIGHSFNFYAITTQTANDLTCLFRQYFHPTHVIPTFTTWCWQTITGITGMLLTIQFFLVFVFSTSFARKHAFQAFWIIHLGYPLFFLLMILHGAGRMMQPPSFYYFMLGPVLLFTFDQIISIGRKKSEITVCKAELLPSEVTHLEIKKPLNFVYKSGQWIKLACTARGKYEYHPFTLTSAPHEENLKVHIRAVGPWTMAIRKLYDPRCLEDAKLPTVCIDGPFGEGNQDWHRFKVSVLIGGGIGVTPYASILKDIIEMSRQGSRIICKKVYFIWVTRTQSQFEWLTDILRAVEEKDTGNMIDIQVFITQFKERFDIRTNMLYVCEKYFQKISEKSLFTGLKAPTYFGRPNFRNLLQMVRSNHPKTSRFGVFSCGPPPLTQTVDKACAEENKETRGVLFEHHEHNI